MDWQPLALGALGLLYGGLLWEVRQLRKVKHLQTNKIQYALLCLFLLARHVSFDLPKEDDVE